MQKGMLALLHKHNLKATEARIRVLDIIVDRGAAISQPLLEKLMGEKADRVTLYRILNAFEEKGILHKVMGIDGTVNYALCSADCTEHEHHDDHYHFNCTRCKKVYCLKEVQVPIIKMPPGFNAQKVDLSVTGICEKCS